MTIRFYNGKILKPDFRITEEEVYVTGSRIAYVGRETKEADIAYDLKGDLLMPGLKNCHAHSAMTLLRGIAEDLPLDEWLTKRIFPMEDRFTPQDVYNGTLLAILEYLSGGITTIADMYFFSESVFSACKDTGMRGVCIGAVEDGSEEEIEKGLEREEERYRNLRSEDDMFGYRFGSHAEYTASERALEKFSELTHRYRAPVYAHLGETKRETEDCLFRTGRTPTQQLDRFGLFDFGGSFYHCVHLTQKDMEILADHGAYAVTNPSSNLKLASGICPLTELERFGIPFALGTDGAASNNSLDLFREMYLASVLQKVRLSDASAMPAETVLRAAVRDGARSLQLDCDAIEEGKYADLIVIDLNAPNLRPLSQPLKNLVYAGNRSNVRMTMINGKILYENGRYFGMDPEKIIRDSETSIARIRDEM